MRWNIQNASSSVRPRFFSCKYSFTVHASSVHAGKPKLYPSPGSVPHSGITFSAFSRLRTLLFFSSRSKSAAVIFANSSVDCNQGGLALYLQSVHKIKMCIYVMRFLCYIVFVYQYGGVPRFAWVYHGKTNPFRWCFRCVFVLLKRVNILLTVSRQNHWVLYRGYIVVILP